MYCCGGINNKGSIEIFDFENLKWNKGPTMNQNRYWFSLVTSGDSIYAFGGRNKAATYSNIVEQLDPREGKWRIIARDSTDSEIWKPAILSNEFVYCFDVNCGGKIFDLRTNNWTETLASVIDVPYRNCVDLCDIVEFNDEIFGVFGTGKRAWNTYKYEHTNNKWTDLETRICLDESHQNRLCVTSEP